MDFTLRELSLLYRIMCELDIPDEDETSGGIWRKVNLALSTMRAKTPSCADHQARAIVDSIWTNV